MPSSFICETTLTFQFVVKDRFVFKLYLVVLSFNFAFLLVPGEKLDSTGNIYRLGWKGKHLLYLEYYY